MLNLLKALTLLIMLSLGMYADLASTSMLNSINRWSQKDKAIISNKQFKARETNSITHAKQWLNTLTINLEQIAKKGYGDKKRLSEALGTYWMLHRYSNTVQEQKAIIKQVKPLYNYTFKDQYLNLLTQDDKQFKKNSMSYLRIMWLLKQMDFDITHLLTKFDKIKPRMNAHLTQRGPWQKSMFARYYDIFGFIKPNIIAHTENMTGLIGNELPLKKYKRMHAYQLTHQVFVAFDYGHKTTQTRFNEKEIKYLRSKLPMIVKHYHAKKSWDLLAELLSCMIYLDLTQHKYFQSAYKSLIYAQNKNGSWGDYERLRPKYGKDTEIKYHLHTTGVAVATILEKQHWGKK